MPDIPPCHLQVLFLGTGSSTALPLPPCLTRSFPYPESHKERVPLIDPSQERNPSPGHYNPTGRWPSNIRCACCRSSVDKDVPEGWKNKRGNTSIVVRRRDGERGNILVDCGKTFAEQARRFFPTWDVKTIDAVLLTHDHADAIFGLDDLREWTHLRQEALPIYLNQATYDRVGAVFPWLVDHDKATGSGWIPKVEFRIINDHERFTILTVPVTTYPVHHGWHHPRSGPEKREPYICLSFMFDREILYMSDVSHIPDTTWEMFRSDGFVERVDSDEHSSKATRMALWRLPLLIMDVVGLLTKPGSHFSLPWSLDVALRFRPRMTYLLGFNHPMTHYMWAEICDSLSSSSTSQESSPSEVHRRKGRKSHPDTWHAQRLVAMVHDHEPFRGPTGLCRRWAENGGGLEPAWDGLIVDVDSSGREESHSSCARECEDL